MQIKINRMPLTKQEMAENRKALNLQLRRELVRFNLQKWYVFFPALLATVGLQIWTGDYLAQLIIVVAELALGYRFFFNSKHAGYHLRLKIRSYFSMPPGTLAKMERPNRNYVASTLVVAVVSFYGHLELQKREPTRGEYEALKKVIESEFPPAGTSLLLSELFEIFNTDDEADATSEEKADAAQLQPVYGLESL